MKRFLLSLVIVAAHAASACAQSCMTPDEKHAFAVIALKSDLMVGALSCNAGERYDRFMTVFQPYILTEQGVMDSFFVRQGGLAGQQQEDEYITALANDQSQASLAQGAKFCAGQDGVFGKVLDLSTPAALDGFVDADALPQPIAVAACAPGAPPMVVASARPAPALPGPITNPPAPLTKITAVPLPGAKYAHAAQRPARARPVTPPNVMLATRMI